MAKRTTPPPGDAPLEVRIVGLSDDIIATLTGLQTRIAALEENDRNLRAQIAALESKITEQARGPMFGATGPVLPPHAQADPDTQVVAAGELAGQLASEIARAHPEDGAFSLDNIEIDMAGALGKDADNVMLGVNPRQAMTGDTATRVKFSLRRRTRIQSVD
ncbi:hypothetical protein FTO60_07740 [Octadecabacter sp. SW4]|uniref:hypothetical protein n=1 Tax=Octadecabacter sp. SW4 TaxID=2602067 RepID=UPI0011C1FBDE|nr:hypothetical protein [Octadecabacter sp. SW4]QEE35606.1 hypothetical protein FTO60_07740 [Octadecabacter sp. SW4]